MNNSSDHGRDPVEAVRERFQAAAERQRKTFILNSVYFAAVILAIVFAMFIGWLIEGPKFFADATDIRLRELQEEATMERARVEKVQRDLAEQLRQISSPPPNYTPTVEAAQLKQRVDDIGKRIENLEAAISASPDKALSVPMLRKDVSELAQRWTEDKLDIRTRLDHVDDMQKWILGGIGVFLVTMLAASGTLIVSLVRKAPTPN